MGGKIFKSKPPKQEFNLPDFIQGPVENLLSGAQGLFNQGGPEVFSGDRVADFTQDQLAGFDALRNFAGEEGQGLSQDAINSARFFLNPENIFNPENIPGLQALNQSLIDTTDRALNEEILPGIEDAFVGAGQLGSSRDAITRGTAAGRATDAISRGVANNNFQAFLEGGRNFRQALGLAPQTAQLGLLPGQVLSDIGLTQQSQNQAELQGQIDQFNEEQQAPFFNQNQFAGILAPLLGGAAGGANRQFAGAPSPFSQGLGIASKVGGLFGK